MSSSNDKKSYNKKRNKTLVTLLSAHNKWEVTKQNWKTIKFQHGAKVRPRPECVLEEEQEVCYSTGGSFQNIPNIIHHKTNDILLPKYKIDSHFANHLLYVHDKYCQDCFHGDVTSVGALSSVGKHIDNSNTYKENFTQTDFVTSSSVEFEPPTFETTTIQPNSVANIGSMSPQGEIELASPETTIIKPNSTANIESTSPKGVTVLASHSTVEPNCKKRRSTPYFSISGKRLSRRLWTINRSELDSALHCQHMNNENNEDFPDESPQKRLRLPTDIIQSTPIQDCLRKHLWRSMMNVSPVNSSDCPNNIVDESFKTNATIGSPITSVLSENSTAISDEESSCEKSDVLQHCFVNPKKIVPLVRNFIGNVCKVEGCNNVLHFKVYFSGAIFIISWTCCNRKPHSDKWTTTDANFNDLLSSSILYSGASYSMLETLFDIMNVQFLSHTSVYEKQRNKCYPAIQKIWDFQQVSFFAKSVEPVVVLVDSRCDSPGYCAKLCSCTGIDLKSQKIIGIEFADRRHTDDKSVNMEPYCFRKLIKKIQEKCSVTEVVTDGHIQIKSIMKKEFPNLKHSHDIWHVSKNLRKKLHKVAKEKFCSDILPWIKDLVNHFWWCAETCNCDEDLMRTLWLSFLHHVQNEHEWATGGCYHEDLNDEERDKPWLLPYSVAYQKLEAIVRDRRFLEDFTYYINFRHTGALESYHSLMLKYVSKRLNFTWRGYIARNIVTVLDYNSNIERPQAKKKDGELRTKNKNSKVSSNWTMVPIKVVKTNAFAKELLQLTLSGEVNMSNYELFPDDPKKVRKNIALTPCPPRAELEEARMKYTRFQNKNLDEDVAALLRICTNDDLNDVYVDEISSEGNRNDEMNEFLENANHDESDKDDYQYLSDLDDNFNEVD